MTTLSRRDALSWLGGAVLGGVVAGVGGVVSTAREGFAAKTAASPALWTPHKLDAAECAPLAHAGYWYEGLGCCYGVFESIIGSMGRKHGAPYNQFPFTMMEVGKSGISDWGTVCGALLGAASAFALFWGRKERDPMVTELFRWYEKTAFPMYTPAPGAPGLAGPLPTHVSGSVLCHLSVSTWSLATGIDANSKQRGERCSRITADVAV
ncbi:MAG: C-GCAxxG-C-C family protein, partial [Humidesulfovibrio sp.]|nr:C-GCAxxG-C-C family protein [Humidesulfovibrio sp.]